MLTATPHGNCTSRTPLALVCVEGEFLARERQLRLCVVDGLVSVSRKAWLASPLATYDDAA